MGSLIQGLLGLVFVLLGIPLFLGKVPQNALYGLRTRKTLDDEGAWYKANRFAGAAFAIAGAVILIAWALLTRRTFEGPVGFAIVVCVGGLAIVLSMVYAARL